WLRKARRKLLAAPSWTGINLLVTSAPLLVTGSVALHVLFSVVPVIQVWLMKQLIDLLSASLPLAGSHAGTPDGSLLILLAVLYLLTLILPQGLQTVEVSLNAAIGERIVAEIDRRVMGAAARLVDLQRIEEPSFHDEVKLIQQCAHDAAVLLPNVL